jgi:L-ascorbate metabolism protein UlaG (beta-lactamase superfamily)
MTKMNGKIKQVICGLGVGAHLEHWGFAETQIIERDWNETVELGDSFTAFVLPTRHFSGRGFSRNKSLWASYLLQTPKRKIYIGGDSGYDTHFEEIGKEHGPVDLAILENGQYDKSWKYIHMMPEEVVKAAQELQASRLFPVHSSKFALGNHAWDEPLKRVSAAGEKEGMALVTPIIGQAVYLDSTDQAFERWWEGVK